METMILKSFIFSAYLTETRKATGVGMFPFEERRSSSMTESAIFLTFSFLSLSHPYFLLFDFYFLFV